MSRLHPPICGNCLPTIVEIKTGRAKPDDDPLMAPILDAWDALSDEERQAWHRYTCQNMRGRAEVAVAEKLVDDVLARQDRLRATKAYS